MAAYEILLLNTAIPQIQAAQSGDTYVVPRDIAFSTVANLANGTNLLPSLTFSSDTNTGIYREGADALGFTAGGGTNQMVLTSTGLGIGTNNPGQKLEVAGNILINTSGNPYAEIKTSGAGNNPYLKLTADTNSWTFQGTFSSANDNLLVLYNATTLLDLDSSGNLGLGVTISNWQTGGKFQVGAGQTIGSVGNGLVLASNWYYNTGDKFAGTGYASYYNQENGVHSWHTSTTSGSIGNNAVLSQAMTLDASGNLLVGKTAISYTTDGGEIRANGQINSSLAAGLDFWNSYSTSAGAYRFYVTNGGTIFATSTTISAISDIRFKENVRDLDVGLDAVMALKPRLYDWKEGKGSNTKNARGFIAQEFEQVFPDLIDEWKDPAPESEDPYKSVRQDLIPVLVKAIQEQQAMINELKAEVAALKGA